MTIKIRIPKANGEPSGVGPRWLPRDPLMRAALLVFLIVAVSVTAFFSYYYIKYDRIIEKRFRTPVFANSAKIYALPRVIREGQKIEGREIATDLRRAGYSEREGESKLGTFHLGNGGIEITPGAESYHSPEPARITIGEGQVTRITSRGTDLSAYELEPQLVTALFDAEQRSKRQVVRYNDIPPVMVQAVLAIEDRRFFEHSGINFGRTIEAVWEDVVHQRRAQGGSTLTQQLARGFFLTPEKAIKRKLTEMLIAEELEQKFSKQQIFEFYANWVNLGQRDRSGSAASPRLRGPISIRISRTFRCRKRHCWRESSRDRAGCRLTGIRNAPLNGEIWCSTRWSRRTRSRRARRQGESDSAEAGAAECRVKRRTLFCGHGPRHLTSNSARPISTTRLIAYTRPSIQTFRRWPRRR